MRVVYLGRTHYKQPPPGDDDVLGLLVDNWDDFTFKTSFPTVCRIDGQTVDLGGVRILVAGKKTTFAYLDELIARGWDGEFPLPDTDYISVPMEITFYEQLIAALGPTKTIKIARAMRDASYLVYTEHDAAAAALTNTEGFRRSLQRERGSVKAYLDGWKVIAREAMAVMDLGFRFEDVCGGVSKLELKFQSEDGLPHDINVLIGPNGVGKSQVLHQIVGDWLSDPDRRSVDRGFAERPNLSQVVVVSYSPFERFPVDVEKRKIQDKDVYRYFGFRDRRPATREGGRSRIELTHEAPKRNSAQSLIDCLADDMRFRRLQAWSKKLETAERVLKTAFEFDYAAVRVPADVDADTYYQDGATARLVEINYDDGSTDYFLPISSERVEDLHIEHIRDHVLLAEGVTFLKDDAPVELSSGQKLFSFIVINILGAIRRDSLVLIDEPELFLHPTLEIQFIDMLKQILEQFNSKALLATHSVVTVRETPARCVHVFARTEDGLVVSKPPFQTFGGDVQRITSYVFGDRAMSKPFERWIEKKLEDHDPEALIANLGEALNEELIVQIRARARD